MSRLDDALKRWQQEETGPLPADFAAAADWLLPQEGEDAAAPAGLLDRFSTEDAAPVQPQQGEDGDVPAGLLDRFSTEDEAIRPDGGGERRQSGAFLEPGVGPMPGTYPSEEGGACPLEESPKEIPPDLQEEPLRPMALFTGFSRSVAAKVVSGPLMDRGTAEQYRRLAATLHHAQAERGIKKVMVTSAVAGEGKTLTALNIALTLSESYQRRVVFIDADLRCSRVHELLNVANVTGLSEVLKDARQMQAQLLQISPTLWVLLAGCSDPDPMSGLTSQRMAQILDEGAASFDWVIVDTPPVMVLPDSNLLARMVDAAIVVVRAGQTAYDFVDRAVQAVDRKRVLGVVLNDVQDAEALQYYDSGSSALE